MSKKTTKTVETFIGTSKREEKEEAPKLTFIKTNKTEMVSTSSKEETPKLTFIKTNKTELVSTSSKKQITPAPQEKAEEKVKEKTQEKPKEKTQAPAKVVTTTEIEIVEKPRLSPLRTRLKERTEKCAAIIIEEPVKNKSKSENTKSKPKKEKETKPVVYKSPTWYKSPRVKLIKPENQVLKDLLRKDPRYTEREVEKIVSDHT